MDVIIKDVPEGCDVKTIALVAIERFIRKRDVKIAEEVNAKFESDIDTIRVTNGLDKKFDVGEAVVQKV